ncbi:DNA gyrase inhibitor YacG [Candidatus Liberibacter asiaticus]|uniref:DNA gyrase inhibitor YacG n=2 Tax=Liberibacter asiaticus TaxID=34021 RepID=C6XEZ0_LIBAP|nr:DNA gyrase inhibitor YacG [Candidatus Liberibacter asiaticus]ACT56942.1 zinc-binding protein [Candidatus Liberibacter asiaticus str. psy62]AGH16706.1 zinc-binding protein [Candidatus Liberibacter asiaticus str. gxpsy]ALK07084.1 DNA gyrase inhibitor YacG [Candidatus Liberibacter asiaticus]ASK52556.1 DNA gyrase inhibitor YacG [Candidatus Liberibacter asiaticus]AWL13881.1 DNA gyrase inhibitor YacG [Candidatus Liberibacter asiaticus]
MQTSDFRSLKSICPECRKGSMVEFYPFCSTQCRSIDLSRWLHGEYVIAAVEDEKSEEEVKDIL